MTSAIIIGTSRINGNTEKVAHHYALLTGAKVFSLADHAIKPFDYAYQNRDDDFASLIEQLLTFDTLIFASPVYWYAPSAQIKVFLDRLSDLLDIYKDQGRLLRSKKAALIATGTDGTPQPCFEQIFANTFNYLGMDYQGMLYVSCKENLQTPLPDTLNIKLTQFALSKEQ